MHVALSCNDKTDPQAKAAYQISLKAVSFATLTDRGTFEEDWCCATSEGTAVGFSSV